MSRSFEQIATRQERLHRSQTCSSVFGRNFCSLFLHSFCQSEVLPMQDPPRNYSLLEPRPKLILL